MREKQFLQFQYHSLTIHIEESSTAPKRMLRDCRNTTLVIVDPSSLQNLHCDVVCSRESAQILHSTESLKCYRLTESSGYCMMHPVARGLLDGATRAK